MPLIIGMDEAGYGPNLGPLVVTATAWEVPDSPHRTDLWREFQGIIAQTPPENGEHLQIADSKQVYAPARGMAHLETGVLATLGLCDRVPSHFGQLWETLAVETDADGRAAEPWLTPDDLPVPHIVEREKFQTRLEAWQQRCHERGIRLRAVRSDIVLPRRFNALVTQHGNKAQALTRISMGVLRSVWSIDNDCQTLVIADKHGGRNRYHDFLPHVVGEHFIQCQTEGAESSRYRVSDAEIRFEMQAERHFPVAVASMVSKYIRELSMVLFNRFWTSRLPDLKPTAGYPGDATRFRRDIAALQTELGIADDVLWRQR